jgi:hypothetical protein
MGQMNGTQNATKNFSVKSSIPNLIEIGPIVTTVLLSVNQTDRRRRMFQILLYFRIILFFQTHLENTAPSCTVKFGPVYVTTTSKIIFRFVFVRNQTVPFFK